MNRSTLPKPRNIAKLQRELFEAITAEFPQVLNEEVGESTPHSLRIQSLLGLSDEILDYSRRINIGINRLKQTKADDTGILETLASDYKKLLSCHEVINHYLQVLHQLPQFGMIDESSVPDYQIFRDSEISFIDFVRNQNCKPQPESGTFLSILVNFPTVFGEAQEYLARLSHENNRFFSENRGWEDRLQEFGRFISESGIIDKARELSEAIQGQKSEKEKTFSR